MKFAVLRWGGLTSSAVISALAGLALLAPAASAAPILDLDATDAVVGGTIEATAELSESPGATGTISFEVFGPGDTGCATPLSPAPAAATVTGEGSYTSGTFTTTAAGVYRWKALFASDSEGEPAEAPCTALSTVAAANPSLAGSASSAVVGGTITSTATLANGFAPTGQLVFRAFGPGDPTCDDPSVYEAQVAIAGNGNYAPAGFAPAAGTYRWTVDYAGDANNDAASAGCNAPNQASVVSKATPGLAATATSSFKGGVAITDNATISGGVSPTGQLVFKAYGPADPNCTGGPDYEASVAVADNGAYAPPGFSPAPGSYQWTVGYSGDANNAAVAQSACGAPNQTSTMSQAVPGLSGTATSVVLFGLKITDNVTLSGGFAPTGQLVFRAYGPADPTCSGAPAYEQQVSTAGAGNYAPAGFAPPPGLYLWTVDYAGDVNNAPVHLACGTGDQRSAVGRLDVSLIATASDSTVGGSLGAIATLSNGAIPGGEITFKAFPPGDVSCSGAAAFTSTVAVAGNGSYRSSAFAPNRVGTYRWTVDYAGDGNHAATSVGCGIAASAVSKATPTITGSVGRQLKVGTKFRDTVILAGGYAPNGTVTFAIYGPGDKSCAKPAFVNTVAVAGNGTVRSDPFTAKRAGTYRFVATYSGDAANQPATEPCGSFEQLAQVKKRTPRLLPLARLVEPHQVSIRVRLSGAASPAGVVTFRLFKPGDRRCTGKPAFSGSLRVKSNGNFALAEYIATKRGIYRLGVGYSGDPRNSASRINCKSAQPVSVG